MELYCTSFENLIKIDIIIYSYIADLNKSFPIFHDLCNVIFKNLKSFKFCIYYFESPDYSNIIKNLYNNINCMPSLEDFFLKIIGILNVKDDLYKKFVSKILTMDLNKINFEIENKLNLPEYYSLEELKKINKNIKKISIKIYIF